MRARRQEVSVDLEMLGPAMLVDDAARVLDVNEPGRDWLRPDGSAPIPSLDILQPGAGPSTHWIEAQPGAAHALLTVLPLPAGRALLLFADAPVGRTGPDAPLNAVLDSLPAMIGYWNRDLRNRFANRAYVAWFGTTPEQIRGKHIRELLGPDIYARNLPFIEGALRGEAQHFERTIPRPDGTGVRHSSAAYIPDIVDGTVVGFSVLVTDVTELKEAETALRAAQSELEARVAERTAALMEANRELERSNAELARLAHIADRMHAAERLAALGTLSAGVAHEINNPLMAITANLTFTLEAAGAHRAFPPELLEAVRDAQEASLRVRDIVAGLKSFSRPTVGERVPIDVLEVVRRSVALLRSQIDARCDLVLELAEVPHLIGNRTQLGEIVINLVANAIEAKPEDEGRGTVWLRIRAEGTAVILEVEDDGAGIPPDVRARMFEPFFTTKDVGRGTGLGLSITLGLVQEFGGTIESYDRAPRGTLMRVTLPSGPAPENAAGDLAVPPPPGAAPTRRVLLIDDEPMVTRAVARMLRGFQVTVEHDARAAMERLDRGDRYDLILCDVVMPQMGGIELFEHLSRHDRALTNVFVFMTGDVFSARARAFLNEGDRRTLSKPFGPEELLAVVGAIDAAR